MPYFIKLSLRFSILFLALAGLRQSGHAQSPMSSEPSPITSQQSWEVRSAGPNLIEIETNVPAWLADEPFLQLHLDFSAPQWSVNSLSTVGGSWTGSAQPDLFLSDIWKIDLHRTGTATTIRLLLELESGPDLGLVLDNSGGIVIVEVIEGYFILPGSLDIHFWPNPCQDVLRLAAPSDAQLLEILDHNGNVLLSKSAPFFDQVDVSALPSGRLYLRLVRDNGSISQHTFLHN